MRRGFVGTPDGIGSSRAKRQGLSIGSEQVDKFQDRRPFDKSISVPSYSSIDIGGDTKDCNKP
jgi:hypothetical protein